MATARLLTVFPAMRAPVWKIHRHWKKNRDYLAAPEIGTLAHIDPALIVAPPKGLGIGYVPIVTRQGWDARKTKARKK